ncbi:MAG: archease [Gammaproteobacteria bacterium]|jgi:SHS2 domain-containing protein
MTTAVWEHFEHRADIGVRGIGRDLAEAFAQAALAMTAIITDPAGVRPVHSVHLACSEPDPELLLVDWLNQVIFEMATRHMLFSRFDVHIGGNGDLQAEIRGETVDRDRHTPAVEIKGATFTELSVQRREDGLWVAQCVVDV